MEQVTLLQIVGVFNAAFPKNNENKKQISDALRELLERSNIETDGKIRFGSDQAVILAVKADNAGAKGLIEEIEEMPGVTVSIADSKWSMLVGRRSTKTDVEAKSKNN